jgi:SseB protein N-terminal domain
VRDLTELVTAARTNDPRVVDAFSKGFSSARFHLPLASLEGVKNHPETALGLGASLPFHRLRLDTGLIAIPLFTSLAHCRECARKLSWKTDGKVVKTLPVPGSMALPYLKELLLDPEIDRLILNPLSDGALHLARTEVEAMAEGQTLRTLWLYARSGGLNRPVEIEGGSLLGSLLSAAGRAVSRTEEVEVSVEVSPPSEAPAQKEPARKKPAHVYIPLEPEAPEPGKKRS